MSASRIRPAAVLFAAPLLGACGSGDDSAEPADTTTSTGAPAQGDPRGANSGAGGDAGGAGAVDPGRSEP